MIRTHLEAGPRIWLAQWAILAPFYFTQNRRLDHCLVNHELNECNSYEYACCSDRKKGNWQLHWLQQL